MNTEQKPEIDALFNAVAEEISRREGDATLEFTTAQLKTFGTDREQIDILWTLAEEAVRDPSAQKKYQDVVHSETRAVQAEVAAKALKQFEQRLDKQVFSLRRGGPKMTKADEGETIAADARIPTVKINPATRSERLNAGLLDAGYIALLALISTVSILWFAEPRLRAVLFSPGDLPLPELVAVGAIFFVTAAIFSFFYPWVAGSRTAGQKIMGLELYEQSGREATQQELFLRSAMLPISALLTVIFPPLWRELGFHNRFSKTIVHSGPASN